MNFNKAMMEAIKNRDTKTPPTKEESYKFMLEVMIKQYDLEGVDLDKEIELIHKKESRLSRRQRDAVVQIFTLKKIQDDVLKQVQEKVAEKETQEKTELGEVLKEAEVDHEVGSELPQDVVEAEVAETEIKAEDNEQLPPPPEEIIVPEVVNP